MMLYNDSTSAVYVKCGTTASATSYSENPEPHLAEVARHFLAGGTPVRDKAIEYAQRAGDRAASQLAHEEAVRHHKAALDVLDATGSGDADTACELLLSLGEVAVGS